MNSRLNQKSKDQKSIFSLLSISIPKASFDAKRRGKDIWQGLYQFPLMESKDAESVEKVLKRAELPQGTLVNACSDLLKHILTHQHIFARFYRIEVKDLDTFVQLQKNWKAEKQTIEALHDLPKPILIQNF